MTLTEKLGQLTMSSADQAVTGPVAAQAIAQDVRSGAVGSVLNLYGSERVRAMQRLAVQESRLGIPLFFGLDVIHGYPHDVPRAPGRGGVIRSRPVAAHGA